MWQQARLDEVRTENITQLLDGHEHQLVNKDLEEMAKPTEAGERKEEPSPLNVWKPVIYSTAFQQRRPSLMRSVTLTVTGSKMQKLKECNVINLHLVWNSQRNNKKCWEWTLHFFCFVKKKKAPHAGTSLEKSKLRIIPQVKRSMQRHYCGT